MNQNPHPLHPGAVPLSRGSRVKFLLAHPPFGPVNLKSLSAWWSNFSRRGASRIGWCLGCFCGTCRYEVTQGARTEIGFPTSRGSALTIRLKKAGEISTILPAVSEKCEPCLILWKQGHRHRHTPMGECSQLWIPNKWHCCLWRGMNLKYNSVLSISYSLL